MQIHTVKSTESLYNIARNYSVPATKILADNDLCGDRLTVGDQLIIITPTKTVTVRGGDTLESICKTHGVKKRSLLLENPALEGKAKVRPGQILAIRQAKAPLGAGSAVGRVTKGTRREKLTRCLPYITYLVIDAAVISKDKLSLTFDPTPYVREGVRDGKVVMLGVRDESCGEFLSNEKSYTNLIQVLIKHAKEMGLSGILISAESAAREKSEEYCKFLLKTRKAFIGCEIMLFSDVFDSTPTDASELSDGAALILKDISISNTENSIFEFSKKAESSKVFLSLDSFCNSGEFKISIDEAKELCYRCGQSITTDSETLISHFIFNRYKNGISENVDVKFPSLKYIKAKLEALCELGFMGISFDINSVPMNYLSLFNCLFARADYAL